MDHSPADPDVKEFLKDAATRHCPFSLLDLAFDLIESRLTREQLDAACEEVASDFRELVDEKVFIPLRRRGGPEILLAPGTSHPLYILRSLRPEDNSPLRPE